MVYLVRRASNNDGFNRHDVAKWYNAQLWRYDTKTEVSAKFSPATGAVVPIWSRDSKNLYVANDSHWLLMNATGTPAKVAGPLLFPNNWNAYFGQIDWPDKFAWSKWSS
jgi:hypothetical protein